VQSGEIISYLKRNIDFIIIFLTLSFFGVESFQFFSQDISETYSFWQNLQQSFFQSIIFIGALMLIFDKNPLRNIWIGIILGFLSKQNGFIEDHLHFFFSDFGFYKSLQQPEFGNNPQYAALSLYSVLLLFHFVFLFSRKLRSLNILFSAVLIFVNLLIVLFNHSILPSGIMKYMFQEKTNELHKIVFYSIDDFKINCMNLDLRCRVLNDSTLTTIHEPSFELDKEQETILKNLSNRIFFKNDLTIIDKNELRGIYITKIIGNTVFELFEHRFSERLWSSSHGYFSRNCYIISNLWLLLTTCLIHIHRKRRWF
jgi:hypothetical protein